MSEGFPFFKRCTFLFLFFLVSCKQGEDRKVQRSFYYWETVFRLSPKEQQALQQLSVDRLYVKFFDVEWSAENHSPQPAAKSIFQQAPPSNIAITPVVFITQEPLQKSSEAQLGTLATNIASLLSSISTNNGLSVSNEVQIDCDWTEKTKDKYFHLLQELKKQSFFQNKILSATIRLHQAKFLSQAGVPPVDKGLLMCYNMGNLRHPHTTNSIIEETELKKYTGNIDKYPLPLDVALPVFDWYVLFEGETYKGLLRDFSPRAEDAHKERIYFSNDTTVNGNSFKTGQWVRHETSEAAMVKACAELIGQKLKRKEVTVILYRLDESILAKYSLHDLESFYNSLR